ncbi:MAG: NUDIX domain-containing protein [Acidobacteria bacterium]|nr:NUDIX domain-containing protein [Acidobacteriota bacterium]
MAQNFSLTLPDTLTGDEKSVELIRMLLVETDQPFSRQQFTPGHITSTGLVLHPDRRSIAMVLHGRLNRWLLPGGHVEPDDSSIHAAAAREVLEETGLATVHPRVIGADVHGIPAKIKNGIQVEPYHLHHDVLVAFEAASTILALSDESQAVRWVSPEEFDQYSVPSNVLRAYARVVAP